MTSALQMPVNPRRPERRRDPGWVKPFALALGMHALLFALLALGVAWHTEEPAAVQAELWSETIRESGAAPRAEAPAEPAPQEQKPVPREEVVVPPAPPQPVPPPPRVVTPPPPAVVTPPAPTKADIALERQRAAAQAQKEAEQAAERKRIEQQKLEDARQRDLAERKRQDQLKADQLKAEQLKADQQRKADDDRKRQADAAAAKAKADADAKAKADADAKAKADAAAKAKADAAEKAKADALAKAAADKRFNDNVARMMAGAGSSGPTSATGGSGTGQSGSGRDSVSSGPRGDGGYAGRVAQKIRSNTVFDVPDSLSGNPPVVYHVTLDPTGDVMDLRKTQSSGVPGFDEAVERAIRKSAPFPPDASGRPPREFDVSHRPKDR